MADHAAVAALAAAEDAGRSVSSEQLDEAITLLRRALGYPAVTCAWCGCEIAGGSPGPVSHGIVLIEREIWSER